jgi:transcriptional regulator with XRE-family HTH domain
MLATGNQLKAARALAGLTQPALAEASGVNVATIGRMESRGPTTLVSGVDTVRAVMLVFESRGIEFLHDHSGVGVRTRTQSATA